MSKKILAFLLASTLVVSNVTVIHAAEEGTSDEVATEVVKEEETENNNEEVAEPVDEEAKESEQVETQEEKTEVAVYSGEETGKYLTEEPKVNLSNEVTGAEAIKAVSEDENAIFLDLRASEDYEAGHIKGTISAPVCLPASQGYKVPVALKNALVEQIKGMDLTGKKLYLSCYAGTFCVNYAADWLMNECGIPESQLVRVLGGTFGDADLKANSIYVSPDYALKVNGIILDVRATETYYADGYVDGSLHQPLFKIVDGKLSVTDYNDDLTKNFNQFVTAKKDLLTNNTVYILCNSGSRGAEAAHSLLSMEGIKENVRIIEGGANAMKVSNPSAFVKQQYVSSKDTIAAIGNDDVVIMDVRAAEGYAAGHIKGAVSYPVFNKDGVSNGYDDLAKEFLAQAGQNAASLAGKKIYVICNSGARGAQIATKLLMQAGLSNANIYTVEGGYKGTETDTLIKDNSTYTENGSGEQTTNPTVKPNVNNKTPKTGDTAPIMVYAFAMLAAAAAFVESKKRIGKNK